MPNPLHAIPLVFMPIIDRMMFDENNYFEMILVPEDNRSLKWLPLWLPACCVAIILFLVAYLGLVSKRVICALPAIASSIASNLFRNFPRENAPAVRNTSEIIVDMLDACWNNLLDASTSYGLDPALPTDACIAGTMLMVATSLVVYYPALLVGTVVIETGRLAVYLLDNT